MSELVALDNPAVTLTEDGLTIRGQLSFDAWVDVGKRLTRVRRAIHFALGDWLNYGEQHYGEMYSQAMDATGLDYSTLATDKWVAGKFSADRRHNNLSFSHHKTVAALPETVATRLLDAAEENSLNCSELRDAVKTYQGELRDVVQAQPVWSARPCPKVEQCPHVREWRERVEQSRV